jgi:hypothetical protein
MPYAQGVTWAMTSRIQGYQALFRITQATGLGTDAADSWTRSVTRCPAGKT